jgi:hypothetical protein
MLTKIIFLFFIVGFTHSYIFKSGYQINMVLYKDKPNKKKSSGYDERYPVELPDKNQLKKIIENYHKYELLKKLENSNISINEKINLIEKEFEYNKIIQPNIKNGGLMDDFDFNFD